MAGLAHATALQPGWQAAYTTLSSDSVLRLYWDAAQPEDRGAVTVHAAPPHQAATALGLLCDELGGKGGPLLLQWRTQGQWNGYID